MKNGHKVLSLVILLVLLFILLPLFIFFIVDPKEKVLKREQPPDQHVVLPPEGTLFYGPAFIGGDVEDATSTGYNNYTILTSEIPEEKGPFGRQVWTHDAGFMAVLSGTQHITFYYVDLNGVLTKQQEIDFSPYNIDIYTGAFAPWFNTPNEIYYLILTGRQKGATADQCNWCSPSMGQSGPDTSTDLILVPPDSIYVVSYAVTPAIACNSGSWNCNTMPCDPHSFQWVFCQEPLFTAGMLEGRSTTQRVLTPQTPFDGRFIGSLGENIQVVLDDIAPQLRHSLYVRGSSYHEQEPGGGLYWFILTDNNLVPGIQLVQKITDPKLFWASQFPEQVASPSPPPFQVTGPNLLNGFGSSFFVTQGLSEDNLLYVGNPSNEDNANIILQQDILIGAMPEGYIQGYQLTDIGRGKLWDVFKDETSARPDGIVSLEQRYNSRPVHPNVSISSLISGFGYSTFFDSIRLLTTTEEGENLFTINTQPWSTDPTVKRYGITSDSGEYKCNGIPIENKGYMDNLDLDVSASTSLYRRGFISLSRTEGLIVNIGAKPGGIVWKLVRLAGGDPQFDPQLGGVTRYDCLQDLQVFGNEILHDGTPLNSGWPNQTATINGYRPASFVGPGQCPQTFLSRTGRTSFLTFNDPMYKDPANNIYGRVVLFVKLQT